MSLINDNVWLNCQFSCNVVVCMMDMNITCNPLLNPILSSISSYFFLASHLDITKVTPILSWDAPYFFLASHFDITKVRRKYLSSLNSNPHFSYYIYLTLIPFGHYKGDEEVPILSSIAIYFLLVSHLDLKKVRRKYM